LNHAPFRKHTIVWNIFAYLEHRICFIQIREDACRCNRRRKGVVDLS